MGPVADTDALLPDGQRRYTLAEKLQALFRAIRPDPASDRQYSYPDVTRQLDPGIAKSSAYLAHLVRGTRTNTTADYLCELATFFNVDPTYLLDRRSTDDQRKVHDVHRQLLLLAQLHETGLSRILLTAQQVDAETTAGFIDLLHAISPLPETERHHAVEALQRLTSQPTTEERSHTLALLDILAGLDNTEQAAIRAVVNTVHSLTTDERATLTAALARITARPARERVTTLALIDAVTRLDHTTSRTVLPMITNLPAAITDDNDTAPEIDS